MVPPRCALPSECVDRHRVHYDGMVEDGVGEPCDRQSGAGSDIGRSGGIGRRTGLKIRRLKGRGGSIPPFGIAHDEPGRGADV